MSSAEAARLDWQQRIHQASGQVARGERIELAAPAGLRAAPGAGHVTLT
ncbi:hypothetical protein [Nonomuraea lactucae]|nr:hypothetical protein [Nonomuraea lactucae]